MRSYEVLTEGSNKTEMFCQQVLEPAANFVAGEEFRRSAQCEASFERQWKFEDNTCTTISFSAEKTDQTYRHVPLVYKVEVSISRPRTPEDWWPPKDEDEEEVYDIRERYQGEDEDIESDCIVQEVWKYQVSEVDYTPLKEVSIEHYDEFGDYIECESTKNYGFDNTWYSEDSEEDVLLHVLDAGLSQSLSERDILEMQGALIRLGVIPAHD